MNPQKSLELASGLFPGDQLGFLSYTWGFLLLVEFLMRQKKSHHAAQAGLKLPTILLPHIQSAGITGKQHHVGFAPGCSKVSVWPI